MNNADTFLPFLHSLADEAGVIARSYFRAPCPVDIKKDNSPVTKADQEIEAALRKAINAAHPNHGILGEEGGAEHLDAEYVWIIDPIDGTRAFMAGIPTFTTLIGLMHNGKMITSVIDQPITGDRWVGEEEKAFICHPELVSGSIPTEKEILKHAQHDNTASPINSRPCPSLAQAIIATTSPHYFNERSFKIFESVRKQCRDCIYGKDGFAYAMLAHGQLDIVMESGLKPYDFLPLIPIVQGAGGIITDWSGAPLTIESEGHVLACGDKRLHAKIMTQL